VRLGGDVLADVGVFGEEGQELEDAGPQILQ